MKENRAKILGENIKNVREANRLSKTEMAKRIGIGVKSLSMLEEGNLPPRLMVDMLFKVESEFEIPAYRLLCDDFIILLEESK